ncbi:hypothetical protein HGRIS_001513 [Hohenbuehelia grisea]|uniref:Uncharacterized protein n=1 Tax=Hohenbuehelia grisea TaxID=104357 RepID=A0ABR3JPI9_9AGAR
MAKGLFNNLQGIDAFGKTTEDVKVKPRTGAFLTILSAAIILSFTAMEFFDYRRVTVDTSIVVDKSRGEKLTVNMNVTFRRVPCYLLSVDVMDISGETQRDLSHNVLKTRLDEHGVTVPNSFSAELKSDIDKMESTKGEHYCGSCYGGLEPPSGCCQTCEEVRQPYVSRGWSFTNPDAIEQCKTEGWADKLREQSNEGCNVNGRIRVNKVIGNIHVSIQIANQHSYNRTCAIVGGVLTVASLLDSILFATGRALKKSGSQSYAGTKLMLALGKQCLPCTYTIYCMNGSEWSSTQRINHME